MVPGQPRKAVQQPQPLMPTLPAQSRRASHWQERPGSSMRTATRMRRRPAARPSRTQTQTLGPLATHRRQAASAARAVEHPALTTTTTSTWMMPTMMMIMPMMQKVQLATPPPRPLAVTPSQSQTGASTQMATAWTTQILTLVPMRRAAPETVTRTLVATVTLMTTTRMRMQPLRLRLRQRRRLSQCGAAQ